MIPNQLIPCTCPSPSQECDPQVLGPVTRATPANSAVASANLVYPAALPYNGSHNPLSLAPYIQHPFSRIGSPAMTSSETVVL
jgi:hypothetical protein